MGRMTLKMWLKLTIAKIGWSLFIWANDTTEDKYWKQIYEIERKRELSEQESNCNLPDVSNSVFKCADPELQPVECKKWRGCFDCPYYRQS